MTTLFIFQECCPYAGCAYRQKKYLSNYRVPGGYQTTHASLSRLSKYQLHNVMLENADNFGYASIWEMQDLFGNEFTCEILQVRRYESRPSLGTSKKLPSLAVSAISIRCSHTLFRAIILWVELYISLRLKSFRVFNMSLTMLMQ